MSVCVCMQSGYNAIYQCLSFDHTFMLLLLPSMPVSISISQLSPHYFWFPCSFPVCCRTFKHLGSRHWCWCTAQQMVRENKLWQNENAVSVVHHRWAQRSMQFWKVMRQMVFNQKIKRKVGYLNWCRDFQRKTFTGEPCMSNVLRYFHPARIWLSLLFPS